MVAIIVGVVFMAAGIWGMVKWFPEFLVVARGFGSISLLMGGLIAILAGATSLRPGRHEKKK